MCKHIGNIIIFCRKKQWQTIKIPYVYNQNEVFISDIAQDQMLLLLIMVDNAVIGPKILFIINDKE